MSTWVIVSVAHTGTVSWKIHNQSLALYGGATGALVADGGWWRLVVSQLLHVYLLHALLNAAAILVVGSLVERLAGSAQLVLVLIGSGVVGQLIAIGVTPSIVATGASQAALGVSGCALVLAAESRERGLFFAAAFYVVVQVALDLLFAGHVKLPHLGSFLCGLIHGYCLWKLRRKGAPWPT